MAIQDPPRRDSSAPLSPLLRERLRNLLGHGSWRRTLVLRRLTAGMLVLLAAALALRPDGMPTQPTQPLLVTARDLAPGTSLTTSDVREVSVPASLRPAAALHSMDQVAGRVLAGPASAGEPLTEARLVGPRNTRLSTGGPDAVAVPVRLADPVVAELLAPGTRVDVVTVGPRGAAETPLASNATVVTVRPDDSTGPLAGKPGRLVVIALPRESATRVASISLSQPVTVTIR